MLSALKPKTIRWIKAILAEIAVFFAFLLIIFGVLFFYA